LSWVDDFMSNATGGKITSEQIQQMKQGGDLGQQYINPDGTPKITPMQYFQLYSLQFAGAAFLGVVGYQIGKHPEITGPVIQGIGTGAGEILKGIGAILDGLVPL